MALFVKGLPMKYTPQKKKFIVLIIDIIFVLTFIALYNFLPTMMESFPGCILAKLNLPCLGCGGTRCIKAVLHLEFLDAFLYNPFIFICVVLAVFLLIIINLAWVFKIKKAQRIFEDLSNPRYVIIFLILFIIFAILRITGICPVP